MRAVKAIVAHALPERTRISIPRATGHSELLEKIHALASKIPAVIGAEVNAATGSLVLHHRRGLGHEVTKIFADAEISILNEKRVWEDAATNSPSHGRKCK